VYLAESGTAVSVETAEVDPLIQGLARDFVSVLNCLCDIKHVKSTHKRFQTEWKEHERPGSTSAVSTKTAVPLSAKYTMNTVRFNPHCGGVEAVRAVFGW
jgi:ABC-type sulfate transport system substrate-binding protein